uniref:Uncharacterized protein n=1 Tax=Phytophthora ramorum TaxID=164328 RepID=H3GNP0_PHYRM
MALFQGDDPDDVFKAALSFVDEFEFAPANAQVQAATSLSVVPLPKEEKRRRRAERKRLLRQAGVYSDPNRARNEQTREIAFLREQMEKLQLNLHVLQNHKTRTKTTLLAVTNSRPSLWQEQAERQRRRREEAECDNVRLRLAMERQKKVADSLGVLIRKRTRQLNNECASLISQCCANHPVIDVLDFCGDVEDFRELFYRLDAAYRDVDVVFAANGLTSRNIPIEDVHMREGVDGKYLEFFTYKDLPFGLQDTAQVSWDYFKGAEKHMASGNLYQKMAKVGDMEKSLDEPYTIIEEFTKEVYSNNSRADVKMRQVVRRYVEADRDVVIRVSHAAPIEVKNKMLRGLTHNVRGFAVTRRSPASTPEHELTQLQLCTQIALELNDGATYDANNVRALTNFLIVHGLKNTVVNRQYIENALADRALKRRIH